MVAILSRPQCVNIESWIIAVVTCDGGLDTEEECSSCTGQSWDGSMCTGKFNALITGVAFAEIVNLGLIKPLLVRKLAVGDL